MSNSKFSVIIRSRNEENWIGHSIQSVLDKIFKPEIIVVDNNSTDRTLEIVKLFSQDPNLYDKKNPNYTKIKILNIDEYTPGKALNYGVKNASNENLLILSSHCVLKSFEEKKHINDLKKYVSIFGNQTPILDGKRIAKRYIWSHFQEKKVINMFSNMEDRFFHHNAIAIYKKSFLKKNKFDEFLSGKEDRYWANDMIKKKNKILYDPKLLAEHHFTPSGNTWKGLA
tara:strand:- start:1614 stop:2294 length:681 start_codon:yes stop_codon:yes gene_type:complete